MGKNSQSIGRSMVEVGGLVVVSASTAFFFFEARGKASPPL